MLKPGEAIDIWVVDRALGQGGMGSVYRCHNREAKRILAAVKVLDSALGRQDLAKARFIREAEILFSLDHPGIVKVRNVRMDLAMPYLEMEFIDGVTLEARMREGPMAVAEALPVFRQVADALAYLHGKGIRHRDIKPSNIVIQPSGVVKIVDFGIASEADGATLTQHGQTFGSVSYAPPEWLEPANLDAVRWDIYAAGVVFWEVLSGVQAFPMPGEGNIHQQVVRLMTAKQGHAPLDPGPRAPECLRALLRDMTQADWRRRIGDAETVRTRLATVDPADVDPARHSEGPAWTPEVPRPAREAGATMVPGAGDDDGIDAGPAVAPVFAAPPNLAPLAPKAPPPARAAATLALSPEPHPEPIPAPPPARRWPLAIVGVVALGLLAFGLVTLLAPPDLRDVTVRVTGLPAGTPVAVTLGGAAANAVDGHTLRFTAVPTGPVALRAAVGADCRAQDGDPAWCAMSTHALDVTPDRASLEHALPLALPAPRALSLTMAGLPADAVPRARLGDGAPVDGGATGVTLSDVAPGRHTVTAWLGTCTDADVGCSNGTPGAPGGGACPPGCASWQGTIEVGVGEGPYVAEVTLPVPSAPAATAVTAGASVGRVAEEARVRGPSGVVTVSAFAKWLAANPAWAPEAARAAGKADAAYLTGWDGTAPPAGKSGAAVVNVSWAAASAYCARRGGLPGLDDGALTWVESSTQPWHEYRSADGRPAWRRSDGATSVAVNRGESGTFIGFRCAR